MSKITKAIVQISGVGWQGRAISLRQELLPYQIENMRGEEGHIPRENFERWLRLNTVAFARITRWEAQIEDGRKTVSFTEGI